MDSTNLLESGQGGTTPAVLTQILSIARRKTDRGYRFTCELAGGGDKLTVEVSAAELQSYSQFQRAVASRSGAWFRDESYETRRGRGAELWAADIEGLLSEGATEK